MLFVLTPSSVARPLDRLPSAFPRQVLGRGPAFRPRDGMRNPVFWRLVFEHSLVRYLIALAPFPVAMVIWPHLALPISQAPLLMFGLVLYIESNVLSVPTPDKRRQLIERGDAERGLDLLQVRGRAILTRIATHRDLRTGEVHLIVEQSPMARVAPMTVVSVQRPGKQPEVVDLDPEEADWIETELFGDDFDERLLQRINLSENKFLRDVPLDVRSISAHARLAAMAAG